MTLLDDVKDKYSSSLRLYEKLLPSSKSIPKLLQSLQPQKSVLLKREQEMSLRKRILFFQNFEQLTKDPSVLNVIPSSISTPKMSSSVWASMKQSKGKAESGNTIAYAQTEESNAYSDIFSTEYNWKSDKPKYKPKQYKLRLGKQPKYDYKNYTPNYSSIQKRILAVKINPLPQRLLPILRLKKKNSIFNQKICEKFAKTIDNDASLTRNKLKITGFYSVK